MVFFRPLPFSRPSLKNLLTGSPKGVFRLPTNCRIAVCFPSLLPDDRFEFGAVTVFVILRNKLPSTLLFPFICSIVEHRNDCSPSLFCRGSRSPPLSIPPAQNFVLLYLFNQEQAFFREGNPSISFPFQNPNTGPDLRVRLPFPCQPRYLTLFPFRPIIVFVCTDVQKEVFRCSPFLSGFADWSSRSPPRRLLRSSLPNGTVPEEKFAPLSPK